LGLQKVRLAAAEPAAFSGINLFPGTGGDDGAKGAAAFSGEAVFFARWERPVPDSAGKYFN